MNNPITIRPAQAGDWSHVAELLQHARLPLDGAQPHLSNFMLAYRGEQLVGCAGLERYGEAGLLRSVAVSDEARGQGLGRRLVEQVLARARAEGLRRVFLLTETAQDYFPRFGFQPITRAQVPELVKSSAEFTTACGETAMAMALTLMDFDDPNR